MTTKIYQTFSIMYIISGHSDINPEKLKNFAAMCSTSLQCYKYNSALHLAYFGKNCRYQIVPTSPPLKFFKFGHDILFLIIFWWNYTFTYLKTIFINLLILFGKNFDFLQYDLLLRKLALFETYNPGQAKI